ncbi:MAG: hypothetical protein ACTHOR_01745 [Devosia sp.]
MIPALVTDDRVNLFDAVQAARLLPRPGDVVTVRGGFGRETPARVTVVSVGTESGQAVIDYRDGTGAERWAYLWQVAP